MELCAPSITSVETKAAARPGFSSSPFFSRFTLLRFRAVCAWIPLEQRGQRLKAIVFDGTDVKLVDGVTVRDPGPGEVQVRIVASGLCQSDLSVINGKIPFPVPVILGHEGAGVVEAVGPGVTVPAVGDHVVLSTLATCGQCASCTSGHPTMCRESFGKTATPFELDGTPIHSFATLSTFSERIVVQAGQAVSIPKDIPLSTACLVGCGVLTGAGAVLNRARVDPGDSVVVIGAGGIGLNVIQAARVAGAATIIAIDTNPDKAPKTRLFGAGHFIDATAGDTVTAVRELTDGGAHHVFDCVGGEAITSQAMEMLDWGGQLIMLGVAGPEAKLSVPASTFYMDRSVLGCRYGSSRPGADIPKYLDLYRSGRLLLDELVTKTYELEDFESLMDDARNGKLDRGVLLMPS
ncbi:Zn-dependent alcohol dehydrogenase [Prescottella sp. R16]|uniref:Zn-dependent alcohol dehydrogenase n=1 Tax=Prescottella sp. R16 TaxID=3064529 RepID=UPI00272ECFCF|nr:Zn-dependent alcohol dehydrogenase [Prescottella sp. R16]